MDGPALRCRGTQACIYTSCLAADHMIVGAACRATASAGHSGSCSTVQADPDPYRASEPSDYSIILVNRAICDWQTGCCGVTQRQSTDRNHCNHVTYRHPIQQFSHELPAEK